VTTIAWSECRNGHALTDPANVYITPSGHRRCRHCKRQSDRRTRALRSQRRARYPNPPAVRPHKFRNWAEQTWAQMSERDRTVVGYALGYMTLEAAVA
jgi:hypothetical protein